MEGGREGGREGKGVREERGSTQYYSLLHRWPPSEVQKLSDSSRPTTTFQWLPRPPPQVCRQDQGRTYEDVVA